ncbi:hypothetical protein RND71_020378 [Anisodus tanguticus]|uniref:Uncharacterized protein n=1 Tax=Anisodus tanguticus TaxID=243964 RepID=A0AAE1S0W0_9SOLA|nr:hypothetical protein RND71_020378 [Anisodus tanguticus]
MGIRAPTPMPSIQVEPIEDKFQDTEDSTNAARKLLFNTDEPSLVVVVQGNRSLRAGKSLEYFPLTLKDGVKVEKLCSTAIADHKEMWSSALIGYVIRGMPAFKKMLKFVYVV